MTAEGKDPRGDLEQARVSGAEIETHEEALTGDIRGGLDEIEIDEEADIMSIRRLSDSANIELSAEESESDPEAACECPSFVSSGGESSASDCEPDESEESSSAAPQSESGTDSDSDLELTRTQVFVLVCRFRSFFPAGLLVSSSGNKFLSVSSVV